MTVEEHSIIGGLGSAVCDVLCAKAPTKTMKIGVNDVYGESDGQLPCRASADSGSQAQQDAHHGKARHFTLQWWTHQTRLLSRMVSTAVS